jgi:hypothetical protein
MDGYRVNQELAFADASFTLLMPVLIFAPD